MSDKPKDDWWNCHAGSITLNDEDWEQFIRVMQAPAEPTPGAIRGAKLLQDLYGKRDIA